MWNPSLGPTVFEKCIIAFRVTNLTLNKDPTVLISNEVLAASLLNVLQMASDFIFHFVSAEYVIRMGFYINLESEQYQNLLIFFLLF